MAVIIPPVTPRQPPLHDVLLLTRCTAATSHRKCGHLHLNPRQHPPPERCTSLPSASSASMLRGTNTSATSTHHLNPLLLLPVALLSLARRLAEKHHQILHSHCRHDHHHHPTSSSSIISTRAPSPMHESPSLYFSLSMYYVLCVSTYAYDVSVRVMLVCVCLCVHVLVCCACARV